MEKGNIKNLKELIDLFEHNIKQYKGKHYDEAKTRVDFIDKFFELLGWDVYNEKDYSEQYREVVREDRVEIKGKVKAPDYSFRIGGFRKFFVEAKKPSVNIKHDIEPAFQLRRYAYTAKLPLSILTDFEEFAVYDTRIKPDKHDQASTARIFYCTYKEYEKEFDFIFNTFSKQAILKGSFDQYIEDTKRKKGTSEVDKEFLKFIEKWRENLAKNIALRNKDLTIYELNYAVQKIIDRIIFLRIAEDRDVEDYGKIRKLIENKKAIYPQLVNLFLQADVKYNSGLFNFKADQYTPELKIDDKILKDIIKSIYYPDSPYEFSVFDVEILGNIYEQFLGKTIRLTASHQAKIENKPEVKKAGGVYYTPKYIVDYIVKNTVGEKIKNKTPDQISKLKILDPACGSGSFLLGAYQKLMNYHLEYYTKDKNIKKSLKDNKIYQVKENECRLTIEEKHRILLNNIFGVDIDSQAVEVTKLSLLLKLMEGESQESAGMLFKFSDIKMLPDLSENIKCGNSLIGSDFYETSQMSLFQDEETTRRINVFDWHKEFPDIFTQGGFDIVIGNPPYIHSRELIQQNEKEYYYKKFKTCEYQINTYTLFMEMSFILLKAKGLLGMIVPNYWLSTDYNEKLRKFLFCQKRVINLVNVYNIFENATVDTLLIIGANSIERKFPRYVSLLGIDREIKSIHKRLICVLNEEWSFKSKFKINSFDENINISFVRRIKIESEESLNNYFTFRMGMKPYERGKGIPPQTTEMMKNKIYNSEKKIDSSYQKLLTGKSIKKYYFDWNEEWIKYGKNLAAPRDTRIFEGKRILVQRILSKNNISATYLQESFICNTDIIILKLIPEVEDNLDIKFFLGIIASKFCCFYLKSKNINLDRKAFPKINTNSLESFPIQNIDLKKSKDIKLHDMIVQFVDQMLELQKKYHNAKTENEKTIYKKQIDILDNQIDRLVYKSYGLTEEEIKIVEEN